MPRYKIIALDMDGTLLDARQQISPANRQAIREATKAGVAVVIATGRGIQTAQPYIDDLQLQTPIVTVNGGEIWRSPGRLHRRFLLRHEEIARLRQIAVEFASWYWGYAVSGLFNKDRWAERIEAEEWLKFGFYTEDAEVREHILSRVRAIGNLEITNSDPNNLEINPAGVNKAAGMQTVCRLLGAAMQDVVACGDSLNDIALIRHAGLGVAMGNAQPSVLDVADFVTLTNDRDGVAHVIYEKVLKP
ncbi:MAG TPA: Cof-type HAD-IIB family hydrolase [Bacilli bacterium]